MFDAPTCATDSYNSINLFLFRRQKRDTFIIQLCVGTIVILCKIVVLKLTMVGCKKLLYSFEDTIQGIFCVMDKGTRDIFKHSLHC